MGLIFLCQLDLTVGVVHVNASVWPTAFTVCTFWLKVESSQSKGLEFKKKKKTLHLSLFKVL